MDLKSNRAVIINASNGNSWYPNGTKRLQKSLNYVGWGGDVLAWTEWPNSEFSKDNPYHVKPAAFVEAIKMGYTHILWVDCSVWAVNDPMSIFDIINNEGYYFWRSGYNCAQISSDKALDYFGVDRDTAETWDDCSTSIFGVNLSNPEGREFIETWIQAAKDEQFGISRHHDNQSQDPRFEFSRNDQMIASLIIGKMMLKQHNPKEHCQYFDKELEDSVVFTLRGM